MINGYPADLALLEEPKLIITSVNLDGIASTKEIKDLKLVANKEFTYDLQTPARLSTLTITLQATAKTLLRNQPVPLSAGRSFVMNEIDKGTAVDDFHLTKTSSGYILECRGKTGELRPQIAYMLTLKHKDFRQPVQVMLKTDDAGRTTLGELTDIVSITVPTRNAGAGLPGEKSWLLLTDKRLAGNVIHAKAGETFSVPYFGTATKVERSEFSLVQHAGITIVSQHFSAISRSKMAF